MSSSNAARAATAEAVRDPRDIRPLGKVDDISNSKSARITQPSASPHPGFPRAVAREAGPRRAQPGWHAVAAALARETQKTTATAMQAAFAAALQEMGAAR